MMCEVEWMLGGEMGEKMKLHAVAPEGPPEGHHGNTYQMSMDVISEKNHHISSSSSS
jgi:hypothetical protein